MRPTALAPAVGCSLLGAVLSLAPAVAAFFILAPPVQREQGSQWFLIVGGLTVIAMVVRYVLALASGLMSHRVGNIVCTALRKNILEKVGRLGGGALSSFSQGRMKKMLTEDVNLVDMFISHHLPDVVSAIALPLGIGFSLFFIDWRMGLAALAPLPFALWVQGGSAKIVQQDDFMATYGAAQERMNTSIIEFVRGMPVVKIFNRSLDSCDRLRTSVENYRDMQASFIRKLTGRWGAFLALVTLNHVPLGILGLWLLSKGSIQVAELVLFIMLGPMMLAPLIKVMRIGAILSQLSIAMAGIDALFECEDKDEQPKAGQNILTEAVGTIVVQDLSFSYGESEVLTGINMSIQPGSFVAVVGPSGSGKSSLAALLAGMEKPQSGFIKIGVRDMAEMSLEERSKTVSAFLQDSFIFTGSVFDNIQLGSPHASTDEVVRAACMAQCHERIKALSDGYDTIIGEGGRVQLSGGEKQRIALARCILRDTPVLIMDEATAAMDAENECRIQEALAAFMATKTVIVVTHRIHTVEKADHIIVLNNGFVVAQGTHAQLLRECKAYATMWSASQTAKQWKIGSRQYNGVQEAVA
ncbi:ABC transporter ATP-binding protein [Oleidesulfovibrio sp.]|uniref:ABC transporter ATP-binding protein n=1 Tax=Oleidesulfovibrio sp. TaxID=2909707 RepID=UPI003A8C3660